jgi:hypothetical protein
MEKIGNSSLTVFPVKEEVEFETPLTLDSGAMDDVEKSFENYKQSKYYKTWRRHLDQKFEGAQTTGLRESGEI